MADAIDFLSDPVGGVNRMMDKSIRERATEAIRQKFGTDLVAIKWMQCWMSLNGIDDVDVMAYIGGGIRPHHLTLHWDKTTEQFTVDDIVDKSMVDRFCREFRRFKIDKMTKQEMFVLLVKANRRRKAAERMAYKLKGKVRRMNSDAMTAVGSRQRTIEQQWEVMRDLQRRGLVTTEALEQVLWDVMKVRQSIF